MAWKVWAVSAKSWEKLVALDASSFTWSRVLNGGGSGRGVFRLGDKRVAEVLGLYDIYPGKFVVVLEYSGTVVYAGFVERHTYNLDTMTLTVDHSDIWSLWEDRLAITDRSSQVAKTDLHYEYLTLSSIAANVVKAVTTGSGFSVPVVLPEDNQGGSKRTYYGYDLLTAAEVLQTLMDANGGPDIDFHPRWKAGGESLEWQMRVAGTLSGPEFEYDLTAPNAGAKNMWIKTDASKLVTHAYAVGEGTEVDMKVEVSKSANIVDQPAREAVLSYKDVKDEAQLYGLAQEAIRANNGATRQAGFDVKVADPYKVTDFRLGSTVRWNMRNDPYMTNGWRGWSVMQFSGDLGDWMTVEFQQKGG